jgi:UDP-sulfoquinovose synthase
VIKLGSFGAYASTGLEIPESDIYLNTKGNTTSVVSVPYPKFATDFYHITKANDSLFARAACKNWSMRIIDVMQSTVFGCYNHLTSRMGESTRFDYDEIYGTVVNRFLIQGLIGMKLTVYGDGNHSSGIMVLEDAINVLSSLRKEILRPGQYRVINNNPRSYKIIELAEKVQTILQKCGVKSDISVNKFDPRHEKDIDGKYRTTKAESNYFSTNFQETRIETEIERSIDLVKEYMNRVNTKVINPTLDWSK